MWFRGADLTRADLDDVTALDANFDRVNLTKAWLTDANLSGSSFVSANLTEAGLIRTDLSRARLTGAVLTAAKQQGANLTGADLRSADLVGMENLQPEQLADALVYATTRLDAALSQHPWVQARIKECAGLPENASAPPSTPNSEPAAP